MPIKSIVAVEALCYRCGYKWRPRTDSPTLCARCKSAYWNQLRPATAEVTNAER